MKNDDCKVNDRKINDRKMDEKKFRQIGRRELLKLTPVLALGAFAVPSLQEGLLKKGLGFSDWASARLFRSSHLATTFDNTELTPFAKFPINGYDVDDPGVIFENWTLTVSGAVKKPGEYTLAQVQALPRFRQNTRHICVEGWDVIGRFGGARLSDFLQLVGADPTALHYRELRRRLLRIAGYGDRAASPDPALLRNVRTAAYTPARCSSAPNHPDENRLQAG
jgi:hypothetical protein